jgi:hypothetical protein
MLPDPGQTQRPRAIKRTFKKYDYTSPEKYRLFLKKKFTTLTPRYYSVVSAEDIETVDGPMTAMRIVTNEIDNLPLRTDRRSLDQRRVRISLARYC